MKLPIALVFVTGLSCAGATVHAQSLAEASEAAKQIHHEWPTINSVPVSTTVDLPVAPGLVVATADASVVAPTTAVLTVKDGEPYWRGRMTGLRAQLDADQLQLTAAAATAAGPAVRAMTISDLLHDPGAKYLNSSGGLLVDRSADKLQADTALATLTTAVAKDRAAIAAVEEAGRQAGALPAWLR